MRQQSERLEPRYQVIGDDRHVADVPVDHDACLNCGVALTGTYCASCGQKRPQHDPTLWEFLHDTTHELTDWDGKVPRTLKALLFRPGLLTTDFLAGRRQRWLPPLRLYLLCSVVFFLSGPTIEGITHRSAREAAKLTTTNADGSTTLTPEMRRSIAEGLPGRLFGVARMERAVMHSADLNHAIQAAYPKAMFLLLPLFAFLTSVAWRRSGRSYPAHLYLALHLHAAWFIAFAVVAVVGGSVDSSLIQESAALAAVLYIGWYGLVAFHSVFSEGWGRTIGKAGGVAAVYLPCWLAVILGLLAYAIATT